MIWMISHLRATIFLPFAATVIMIPAPRSCSADTCRSPEEKIIGNDQNMCQYLRRGETPATRSSVDRRGSTTTLLNIAFATKEDKVALYYRAHREKIAVEQPANELTFLSKNNFAVREYQILSLPRKAEKDFPFILHAKIYERV